MSMTGGEQWACRLTSSKRVGKPWSIASSISCIRTRRPGVSHRGTCAPTESEGLPMFWEQIKEDIRVVFERDPAVRSVWEGVCAYRGFHAVLFHRSAHWLRTYGLATS